MTNRPTHIDFVECHRAIQKDWLSFHPEDHSETVRDDKRIALELSSRGLPFFTIDLPAIGKLLDFSLDSGRLVLTGLPHTRPFRKGSSIPRLFKGFWIRLFHDSGHLREDIDPNTISFFRTILYMGKKVKMECAPRYVHSTIKEYYDVETNLPHSSDFWRENVEESGIHHFGHLCDRIGDPGSLDNTVDSPDERDAWSALLTSVQHVADRLSADIGFLEDSDIWPKHGPGAVSETALDGYKYNFPTWGPRLECMFPFMEFGTYSCDTVLRDSRPVLFPLLEESASKLVAVPKTQKGPRLIASEPVCNQWMQQGVANALRDRVRQTKLGACIDFFDQSPSRADVLRASVTGARGSMDLTAASDRLSTWLVQRVLRRNFRLLALCSATRTRFLRNPDYPSFPGLIEIRKFASMGSALTFPIQSIVFAILATGYGSYHDKCDYRVALRKVRVYGDDIIVPAEWVDGFSSLLEKLYLKVNRSKTFSRGLFRESCGMDAYGGYDVTPAYIRSPSTALNTREALGYLEVANNFFLKGYWHLSAYLERTASWSTKLFTVNCLSRAFGWVSFCSGLDPRLSSKVRWDKDLQQQTIEGYRLVSRKPSVSQVESWNALTGSLVIKLLDRGPTPHLIADTSFVSVSSVVESTSRLPAVIRRTRVPVWQLTTPPG